MNEKKERPTVAGTTPVAVTLESNKTYHWCACGMSASQPFCDGSHKESSFVPKSFASDQAGEAHLCMCKMTRNPPYCDGSHKTLT